MKQIIIRGVPEDLGKQFKLWCVDHNISINAALLELMKKRVGYLPKKRRRKKATLTQSSNN
jgi:hypothetical protein